MEQVGSNTYHSRGYFNLSYSQKFRFNYLANKFSSWRFFVDHKFRHWGEKREKEIIGFSGGRKDVKIINLSLRGKEEQDWNAWKFGVIWDSSWQLWKDFYWLPGASYARTLNQEINPVRVALYKQAVPQGFDRRSDVNNTQVLSGDDTEIGSYVTSDIYGSLLRAYYRAQSVGTLSMGFKNMFTLPFGLLIPSVRSRWVLLENLSSYSSVPLLDQEDISTGSDLYQNIASDLAQLYGKRRQEALKSTYTQWLEWTFGLEYLYQVQASLFIILGASYGFRTPVKFWEVQEEGDASDTADGTNAAQQLNSKFKTGLASSFSQVYFKIPF